MGFQNSPNAQCASLQQQMFIHSVGFARWRQCVTCMYLGVVWQMYVCLYVCMYV